MFERRHPQIVFIKGLKVGGTSVAVALNRVAQAYRIRLQDTIDVRAAEFGYLHDAPDCDTDRALYFHHAPRARWMTRCIPYARFATVLREPISQALSWESMVLNREYSIHYPSEPCAVQRVFDFNVPHTTDALKQALQSVEHCVDTPFRQNVTLALVAKLVGEFAPMSPGYAVDMTSSFITGRKAQAVGAELVHELDTSFVLVGVTERLNEFLVLLALHQGWALKHLYYMRCKIQDVSVDAKVFKAHFPAAYAKLQQSTRAQAEAYEHAKALFAAHVDSLGPWFRDVVAQYETGLRAFQNEYELARSSKKWVQFTYIDQQTEYC